MKTVIVSVGEANELMRGIYPDRLKEMNLDNKHIIVEDMRRKGYNVAFHFTKLSEHQRFCKFCNL